MSDALSYAISLQTADAQASMERFNSTSGVLINRLNATGSAAAMASSKGNSLVGTLTRMGAAVGFAALIKRGVEFNATMQDGEGAIAAIIQQFQGLNAEAAKAEAAKAMQQLIDLEPKAAGSLTDLLNGFSSTAAAAAGVGISISQNIDLTGRFANALARLQLPVEQIGQEMRSILTGNIGQDSQLARTLGITNEMVAAAKSAGTLYDMLRSKIGLMGEAADNIATKVSSLQSSLDKALGLITSGVFDVAVGQMGDLTSAINTNAETFRSMGAAVATAANLILTAFSAVKTAVDMASEALAYFKVILAGEDLGTAVAGMKALNQSRLDAAAAAETQAKAEQSAARAIQATVAAAATANQVSGSAKKSTASGGSSADPFAEADRLNDKQRRLDQLRKEAAMEQMSTAQKIALLNAEAAAVAQEESVLQSDPFGGNANRILDVQTRRVELQREINQLSRQYAAEQASAAATAARTTRLPAAPEPPAEPALEDGESRSIRGFSRKRGQTGKLMGGPGGGSIIEAFRNSQNLPGAFDRLQQQPSRFKLLQSQAFGADSLANRGRMAPPQVFDVAGRVNSAAAAPNAAARNAASAGQTQTADPTLAELQKIHAELTRIRTA